MPYGLSLSLATFVIRYSFIAIFSCFIFNPKAQRFVARSEIISLIMMILFTHNPLYFVIIRPFSMRVDYF